MGSEWLPTLLSVVVDWMAVGDGLRDGELVAVVIMGVVEMTDAVFVAPTVEPGKRNRRESTGTSVRSSHLGKAVSYNFPFGQNKKNSLTSKGQTGAGKRQHCIYSQSGGCGDCWAAHKACCARHLTKGVTERIKR